MSDIPNSRRSPMEHESCLPDVADLLDDPRVMALVEALEMAVLWLDYDGRYDTLGMKAALAAIEAQP